LRLRKDILVHHINAYFNYIQDIPGLSFFRTADILRELKDDKVSGVVGAAICALTALIISPDEDGRKFAQQCKDKVDFYIFCNRGVVSRQSILPLALCCAYDWVTGQYARAYRDRSDAADLILLLNLNWDEKSRPFQEREAMRRLVWFFYIFDRWVAGGFDYLVKLRDEDMKLRLPCDEVAFQDNEPIDMERLQDSPRTLKQWPSMHAFFIRLMQIRHRILDKTKALTNLAAHPNRSRVKASEIMKDIESLRTRLFNLNVALPEMLRDTDKNIDKHYTKPVWTPFVMFHTWLYCLYTDLHRFALPDIREKAATEVLAGLGADFLRTCQAQAVAYSISLARLWQTLRRKVVNRAAGVQSMIVADWMAPACLIQAIKILLVARKYQLWVGVADASPAPRGNSAKPVDGAEIQELLECTLDCLHDFLEIKSDIRILVCYWVEHMSDFEFSSSDRRNSTRG
jgi:hypothetical protein